MNLKDAANNLARMVEQCGLHCIDAYYDEKGNPAPSRVIRGMINDVDSAIKADRAGVMSNALTEIERVMGYGFDGTQARLSAMAWANQCARDALKGIFTPEPPRAGPPLVPGDVVTKVRELMNRPPAPLDHKTFTEEYKALEEKFFDHVWDLLKHYKVPLYSSGEGVRAQAREGELTVMVYSDDDGWKKWKETVWPKRILLLGQATDILRDFDNTGQRMLKAIENAKTSLGEWTPSFKRK